MSKTKNQILSMSGLWLPKMRICFILILLLSEYVLLVCSVNGDGGPQVIIYHYPKLYTKNKRGQYIQILNKRGGLTRKYKGGIYLQRGNVIRPVHKGIQAGYLTRNLNQQPHVPDPPSNRLGQLLTLTRDNRYVPILNKRGGVTQQYKGGIYLKDLNRDRYDPVHKERVRGWVVKRRRQANPVRRGGRKKKRGRKRKRGRRN
jgi:hypothetical protein